MIHPSSTDVLKVKKGFLLAPKEKTKLFYGVELECECKIPNDFRTIEKYAMDDLEDYAILKYECTINNGFEVVTVPASLKFHKETLWNKFFKGTAPFLKAFNTGRCGLHVHFSRNAMTDAELARVIFFIHNPSNNTFLSKLAGRDVSRYSKWCNTKKKSLSVKHPENTLGEALYQRDAVSISSRNRGSSVEVRIFRGNTKRQGVMKALELTDAIIMYCQHCRTKEDDLHYKPFLKWFIDQNKKDQYPYLYEYLLKFGFVDSTLLKYFLASLSPFAVA